MPRHRELVQVLAGAQRQVVASARQVNDAALALSYAIRAARAYAPRGGAGQRAPRVPGPPWQVERRLKAVLVEAASDLETDIAKFEDAMGAIGDDTQLANADLQNLLQKQQQMLQMLSDVSATVNDTALAVIRKIG